MCVTTSSAKATLVLSIMSMRWFLKTAQTVVRAAGSLRATSNQLCSFPATRTMSTWQADHLERTANVYRQAALYPARVLSIANESDLVKKLQLEILHPEFSFRAGQWVDFIIPYMEKVGGFSVCSSPGLLHRERCIDLAVKYTKHPPAHWIHTKCTVGSEVELRAGGEFYFDPSPSDPAVDLLLVAGGVGINPLYSILMHSADLLRLLHSHAPGNVHLCYSAKNTKELLFRNSIIKICQEYPDKISCDFHVTQQGFEIEKNLQPYTTSERISKEVLRSHVNPERTLCYLCGPPPMIESVSSDLQLLGLSEDRICFEKWW